jgi:hypothetical protein
MPDKISLGICHIEHDHGLTRIWLSGTTELPRLANNLNTGRGMRVRAYYRQSEMFFSRLIVRAVELTTVVAALNQFNNKL